MSGDCRRYDNTALHALSRWVNSGATPNVPSGLGEITKGIF